MKKIFKYINQNNRRAMKALATVLAAIVVFTTTYSLILPAITIEHDSAAQEPGLVLAEETQDISKALAGEVTTADPGEEISADAGEEPGASAEFNAPAEQAAEATEAAQPQEAPDTEEIKTGSNADVSAESSIGQANASGNEPPDTQAEGASETVGTEGISSSAADTSSITEETKATSPEERASQNTASAFAEVKMPKATFEADTDRANKNKADNTNIHVTVEAEQGTFPEGTSMKVKEVTNDSDVVASVEKAIEASDEVNGQIQAMQAVDISFYNTDGEEIEPLKEIKVTLSANLIREAEDPVLVHVPDKESKEDNGSEPEIVKQEDEKAEPDKADDEINFRSDEFSVYAIVYTVDFSYSVNGEMYDFSLPGGEKIALSDLIEVLGIIRGTQFGSPSEFISHISDVKFSNESLVKVTHKTPALGVFGDEDWVLESLPAFDTVETLTITMDNGDVVRVRVTDAQITKDILTASGETYTITVEYGDDAEIPENADLNVTEITEGSEYNKYLSDSASQLGVEDKDVTFARFFDIEIVDENGEKVEPKTPVKVKIAYKDAVETSAFLHVVHFAEDGTEIIDNVAISEDNKEITYEQDSFSVTGTLLTTAPTSGSNYMVIVKHNGDYYITNNDGSLTPVRYENGKVYVDEPMLWTYTGTNLYHHSIQVDYDGSQVASDFYNKYIDPSSENGLSEDSSDNVQKEVAGYKEEPVGSGKYVPYYKVKDGTRQKMAQSSLSYNNGKLKSTTGNKYIGVSVTDEGMHLSGNCNETDAAEIIFASASDVARPSYLENAVNHIDISIEGHASVDVPLAYGRYYDAEGNELKNVTSFEKLSLTEEQVEDKTQLGITTDDMKRATIVAYTKNGDTAVPLDDAFYITGYSANETTAYSTDQVRIEGSFKVADLDYDIDQSQYRYNTDVWGNRTLIPNNYTAKVHNDRLANRVYYSVTAVKPITFNLVDPEKGQLYDSEGNKLTVTVDVAFSASFNYFDSDNECPPVKWELNSVLNGYICLHDMSGMDFTLGGKPDQDHKVVAIEITKIVVDENGNRIKSNDAGKNTFYIYKNSSATSDSVKDLNIGSATETLDYSGYVEQHSKSLTVGDDGMGNIYDYDVTPGMYYISEDPTSIKDTITDISGQEWDYKETYFLTEYAWRNHQNDNYMHVSETYSGKSGSYSSVPEILGDHPSYDGTEEFTNDFLEFYVYNVYESPKVDVPVEKTWPDFDENDEYDWTATFRLQWAPLYPGEATPSTSFKDVTPEQTITINKAQMKDAEAMAASLDDRTFKDLPKYGTDAQGDTYRIQYSLEEISYTVTDSTSGVVQYSWDELTGYNTGDDDSHYQPFYPHDAGETISGNTDEQNEADSNYYIQVRNAKKNIREKELIDISLDKQWDLNSDDELDSREDSYWAEFELKRFARTEYRDLSQMSDSDRSADPVTVTIMNGSTVVDTLKVQPNVGLYLAGNFKPHDDAKSVTFNADKSVRFANGSRTTTVTATADGSNMSNALVRSREFFVTEDTIFQIAEGADNLVSDSLAKVLDTSAGTSPMPDKTFSQTIRLDRENNWHVDLSNLVRSETSAGDDDDNENVVYYEYYFVEKDSNPEGYAQYFHANNGNLTEILSGDSDHQIDTNESVVAVNGPTNRLIVEKDWRGVPDTTGFPTITFTLYQTWADGGYLSSSDGWVYENETTHETYQNIELTANGLTWICPEVLPTTKIDSNGTSRSVGYYVVEDVRTGTVREGDVSTKWDFYYYINSENQQTNAGHQGYFAGLTGSSLAEKGGKITICNKLDGYGQLDIQKQFFELRDDGSWANTTASSERTTSTVLGFKVIRAIKAPNGQYIDEKGNYSDTPVWMDYGEEMLCGYDANGQQIVRNDNSNGFYLKSAGGDWAFRIEDNQGDATNKSSGGSGLPKNGFYILNGEDLPVQYEYSYRETNVYKDLDRTPYPDWEWFSSITPGSLNHIFDGQDDMRVANFQASDLVIDKQWIGDANAQEVYVKLWRVSGNEEPEDFTAVIADDIRYNNNWQMYVQDTSTVDVYRKWLILKDDGSGHWTTSMTVSRALLGALAETGKYHYYIQEVAYKTEDGSVKTNVNAKYKPLYNKMVDGEWSNAPVGSNDYAGNAITIAEKGKNGLQVINRSTPATSYTVTKSFAGSQDSTSGSTSLNNRYPTDGSKQAVIELQQRYRYEKTEDGVEYVSADNTTWVRKDSAEAANTWASEWQGAESASPVSVALPRTKPAGSSLTDEQWYASAAAWTYTWEGLDLYKTISEDADPEKNVKAQLYYRAVETSTPGWMNEIISEEDRLGHKAVDDDEQTAAEIRAESNGITNKQGDMTLNLNKEWTGLGAGVEWPEGYIVHYQVVQNYHLTGADVSRTKTEDGLTYIDPDFSYDARVIKSVDMTSTNQTGVDADKYHPQADKTLEESKHNLTLLGFPMYGFFTATEDDVEEAAKVGVTLNAGVTYPVVYTYSVRETKVTKDGVEVGFKAQTVDAERDTTVTDKVQYTATLTNEVINLKLTKEWTKAGKEASWPEGYSVEYTIVQEAKSENGTVVDSEDFYVVNSTQHTEDILTSSHTTKELKELPDSGTYTAKAEDVEKGLVEGQEYPVTYSYKVIETKVNVPDGAEPYTFKADELKAFEYNETSETYEATITNDLTDIEVEKTWSTEGHGSDKSYVTLYRYIEGEKLISVKLDNPSDLANGDSIKVTVDGVDQYLTNSVDAVTFTVTDDAPHAISYEPSSGVTLTAPGGGTAPNSASAGDTVTVHATKQAAPSGRTITVKINWDDDRLNSFGVNLFGPNWADAGNNNDGVRCTFGSTSVSNHTLTAVTNTLPTDRAFMIQFGYWNGGLNFSNYTFTSDYTLRDNNDHEKLIDIPAGDQDVTVEVTITSGGGTGGVTSGKHDKANVIFGDLDLTSTNVYGEGSGSNLTVGNSYTVNIQVYGNDANVNSLTVVPTNATITNTSKTWWSNTGGQIDVTFTVTGSPVSFSVVKSSGINGIAQKMAVSKAPLKAPSSGGIWSYTGSDLIVTSSVTVPDLSKMTAVDTVEKTGFWTQKWQNLPTQTADGKSITYYVVETKVETTTEYKTITAVHTYSDTETGRKITIKNTPEEEGKINVSASKLWKDSDGSFITDSNVVNGLQVRFGLYDGDNLVSLSGQDNPAVVTGNGTVTWTGLDKTKTYTVKEIGVKLSGMTEFEDVSGANAYQEGSVTGNQTDGFTITNKLPEITLNLIKVDKNDSSKTLEKAEFSLWKIDGASDTISKLGAAKTATTTADGTASIAGLEAGYYMLQETKSPDGYVKTGDGTVYFKVSAGTITFLTRDETLAPEAWETNDLSSEELLSFTAESKTLTVGNEPGVALPSTGGPGTTLFTILGSILIALAGAGGIVMRKRRKGIV